MVVLPPLICAVLSMIIFTVRQMDLNRTSALLLISIYAGYIYYSVQVFGGDLD